MTEQDRLTMLKIDLKIGSNSGAYDDRLIQFIRSAEKAIIAEGAATLDGTTLEDSQLIVMYAAYQWRVSRHEATADMYRMLRRALNNRIFAEKARGD